MVPLVVFVLVGANFLQFLTSYGDTLARKINVRNNATLAVSDIVRRYTPEDSAILVFGLRSQGSAYPVASWSSEIAYYSQKKVIYSREVVRESGGGGPGVISWTKVLRVDGILWSLDANARKSYNKVRCW